MLDRQTECNACCPRCRLKLGKLGELGQFKVGSPADLVVVEAGSIPEAVATRPRRKMVMKAGRVVARDGALV